MTARCGESADAWIRACAAEQHVEVALQSCPSGVAILTVRPRDGAPLGVELSSKPGAFVNVNGVGVSPIGNFADWQAEPASTRAAFDAVVACVRARSPSALLGDPAAPNESRAKTSPAFPWLLVAATVVVLLGCARARARRFAPTVFAILASAVACFAIRRLLVPAQFLHQNGQAPLWIEFAVRGDSAGYGPGYAEIFRPVVAHAARPDLRLFLVQELLAACTPACAFAIARSMRARFGVAFLVGVAVALDPIAMRLARSESYFAIIATLLMFAGALLTTRAHLLLRACGAGLLVAAAARIHPLAWAPAALLSLLLLARPGRMKRVFRDAVVVAAVIGAVVAVTSLSAMRAVLHSELGSRFLPGAMVTLRTRATWIVGALVILVPLLVVRPTRRVARRALVVAIAVCVARASNVVSLDTGMIQAAYFHLFAPVVLAGVAALIALVPARFGALVLAATLALHVTMDRRTLIVPTDAREQSLWLSWRETLPASSTLVWLERAGTRVLALPLLGTSVTAAPLHERQGVHVPSSGPRFYYRSSLCSTPDGALACAEFEAAHRLRTIERRVLPAIASQPWNGYPSDAITIELFAIED